MVILQIGMPNDKATLSGMKINSEKVINLAKKYLEKSKKLHNKLYSKKTHLQHPIGCIKSQSEIFLTCQPVDV